MHPRAETEVGEQLDHVGATDGRAVDQVLPLAAAVEAARDHELREVDGPGAVGVVEQQLDLAEVCRLAPGSPGEEHVVRLLARSSDGASEPAAQTIPSETFDSPDPFGPTTTATPGSRRTSTGSGNDLKPRSLIALRCTRQGG